MTALDRFLMQTISGENGCVEWQGSRNGDGYGRLMAHGKHARAHRFAYETFVGPIPTGLELDHLCRNRACVNPLHLEAVSHEENLRRSRKSHCKHGHELTPENVELTRSGRFEHRACKACRARRKRLKKLRLLDVGGSK